MQHEVDTEVVDLEGKWALYYLAKVIESKEQNDRWCLDSEARRWKKELGWWTTRTRLFLLIIICLMMMLVITWVWRELLLWWPWGRLLGVQRIEWKSRWLNEDDARKLACMATRVANRHKVPYKDGGLPANLIKLVKMHWRIWSHVILWFVLYDRMMMVYCIDLIIIITQNVSLIPVNHSLNW